MLAEVSHRITSLTLVTETAFNTSKLVDGSVIDTDITCASELEHLGTWPALAKLSCGLDYSQDPLSQPPVFAALKELELLIRVTNPDYARLFQHMPGLETLTISDVAGRPGPSDFYTPFWAAVARHPRLADLTLVIDEPLRTDTWRECFTHPEVPASVSFRSVRRVHLEVVKDNTILYDYEDADGYPLVDLHTMIDCMGTGYFVQQFPHLEHLILTGCEYWPEMLDNDHFWQQLRTLELHNNRARGNLFDYKWPDCMRHMSRLESLVIVHAPELDDLPEWIGELPQLTSLRVASSGIWELPASITQLQRLTLLHFTDGFLYELPARIGSMTALVDLDVSCNEGPGTLPPTLADLTRLTRLNLSNVAEVC